MLRLTTIRKSFINDPIFTDISFTLDTGEKAALVGMNGTGKTTLLKIIAGLEEKDWGKIEMSKDTVIGYVPQDSSLSEDKTIREILGGEDDFKVKALLSGFGMEKVNFDCTISNLSSGQKTKVALTTLLLKKVDILLLDEPTNNLDLPSLIWLEDFLKKSKVSTIIVSHDRTFLDQVCTKILEINWNTKTLTETKGSYSAYLALNRQKLENTKVIYRLQQEQIEKLYKEADNKREQGMKGSKMTMTDNDKLLRGYYRDKSADSLKRAKVIEKRIDQMDKIKKPIEREPLEIALPAQKQSGTLHLTLDNAMLGYPNSFSFGSVSLDISYGKRVTILGLNGSGKSTLLKTLTGELSPLKGKVDIGSGITIGNMMQEHESLPKDMTLLVFLEERGKLEKTKAYELLIRFGFTSEQAEQKIAVLSPGSRARLLIAYFGAIGANVLILDEPTNHLDMEAVEALEEALSTYQGTVILVSHDRSFIEHARIDSFYLINENGFSRIPHYEEYLHEAEKKAEKLMRVVK